MKQITFYKLQASGNDFILIDRRSKTASQNYRKLAIELCRRKTGVGADGLLVIEPSRKTSFKMRIINADGSQAEMCGNGARCVALWAQHKSQSHKVTKSQVIKFETIAGMVEAGVKKEMVKLKTTALFGIKLDSSLSVLGRKMHINYINTGVPHVVVFVEGLDKIDVAKIGRAIRFHKRFAPAGANVNFVEITGNNSISVRTYERGVEAETLACGTGSIASGIITTCKLSKACGEHKVKVKTRGGDILNVYFSCEADKIKDVFLEGKAHLVFKGSVVLD